MKAVHAVVTGRVQGVTYRHATRTAARGLGLVGWVRNLGDGRVEVWAQGDDDGVTKLVDWLWLGPAGAVVMAVESDVVAIDQSIRDFFIRQ
ncbi:MAG TPA: acylphosphatase [Acidimicrobiia bacterium]|jgi:acylphosphatase|nr:acylphosphatase [Acidimicrobiia bacterium]